MSKKQNDNTDKLIDELLETVDANGINPENITPDGEVSAYVKAERILEKAKARGLAEFAGKLERIREQTVRLNAGQHPHLIYKSKNSSSLDWDKKPFTMFGRVLVFKSKFAALQFKEWCEHNSDFETEDWTTAQTALEPNM